MEPRQQRGLQLAKDKRIKCKGSMWIVPSQSNKGAHYLVNIHEGSCTCPDHETRATRCKHQWAVMYVRHMVEHEDGSIETTGTMRVTYAQEDWPGYNAAQCEEKSTVQSLLAGLCEGIVQPPHTGRGRPPLPLADLVYSMTMKVFVGMSGRRAMTDIANGLTGTAPRSNAIFASMQRPDLTPPLTSMVEAAAHPLAAIERDFAVDATGFATTTYDRWFDKKWGREKKRQKWVKAHAMIGTVTNVITSIVVTDGNSNDCPEIVCLLDRTAGRFTMNEVSGDKAYLSNANLTAIEAAGAVPYVPFRSDSTPTGGRSGRASEAWRKMWLTYQLHRDEFLASYHKRSNVEATFSAMKRKFGASVRSKKFIAQVNEVLAKALCYNLSVVGKSMLTLGVDSGFGPAM